MKDIDKRLNTAWMIGWSVMFVTCLIAALFGAKHHCATAFISFSIAYCIKGENAKLKKEYDSHRKHINRSK